MKKKSSPRTNFKAVYWCGLALGLLVATLIFGLSGRLSKVAAAGDKQDAVTAANLWQDVAESALDRTAQREIVPARYRTVRLNAPALTGLLAQAPQEFTSAAQAKQVILDLPLPTGDTGRFRIEESSIMEPALAAKFPEIKTYRGQGLDDRTATVRFDVTPHGFHAQVLAESGTFYIDPYAAGNTTDYVVYAKRDAGDAPAFACEFDLVNPQEKRIRRPAGDLFATVTPNVVNNAGTMRVYRLALAATGEYTQAAGGTVAAAMSRMTTTMNRVNGLYEKEIGVRMVLVANNNMLIFTDPILDPYQNDDGTVMLAQNQAVCDSLIQPINYDIGHVFSTGGGGVAFLRSPCGAQKAGGVTGLPNPVGDAFAIDYVAHEMGHQYGGNHTFNGSTGSCAGGNRSATASFEPGSGTTIQAYAGICGAQDLQRNSNDHFHVRSLEELTAFITGTGNCSVNTATSNRAPTVEAGPNYNIPRNTPFTLTATGSDLDGDALTYNWDEYDLGQRSQPPPAANGDVDSDGQARPIFRSYASTSSPARTFPSLQYILDNANTPPTTYNCGRATPCLTGEILPQIARTMTFQVTARDNRSDAGGIFSDSMQVMVQATAGPFLVTQPNTNITWAGNSTQTVTWSVANTTAAPINAAQVKISLSLDGGFTFPHVLATSTANDGSETVTIPNVSSTTARIKVEAVGNIFFDISNTNFTITLPSINLASVELGTTNSDATQTLIGGCRADAGLVRLSGAAPAGGFVVALSDTLNAASVPATVVVPAGQTTAIFYTTTQQVAAVETGNVIATANSTSVMQGLRVRPIKVRSLSLNPNTTTGNQTVTGTATLECAPSSLLTVDLTSSVAGIATLNQTTLDIPSGQTSGTFTLTTVPQNRSRATIIGATTGGTTTGAKLTVTP